jgi:toluene monooxygenase system ferredoxin subunit
VEIFEGLEDAELEKVKICCEEVKLSEEGVIFAENDPARYLYTLLEGQVSLRYRLPSKDSGEENRVATITPGNTFGWSGLHPSKKYTLTAYCTGRNCTAIRIDAATLQGLLDHDHTIGYKVMKNISRLIGDRFIALQQEVARVHGQDAIDGW